MSIRCCGDRNLSLQSSPAAMSCAHAVIILVTVTFCALIGCEPGAFAEGQFQKLSGPQIRAYTVPAKL